MQLPTQMNRIFILHNRCYLIEIKVCPIVLTGVIKHALKTFLSFTISRHLTGNPLIAILTIVNRTGCTNTHIPEAPLNPFRSLLLSKPATCFAMLRSLRSLAIIICLLLSPPALYPCLCRSRSDHSL
jgi:hypothetical protein